MPDQNINQVSPTSREAREESLPTQTGAVAREFAELLRLRFEHAKIEISEFLDKWVNSLVRNALALGTAGVGGLFLLVAAALGIGTALGHAAWGMLIVGAVMLVGAGAFALTRPQFVETGDKRARVAADILEPVPPRGRPVSEAS